MANQIKAEFLTEVESRFGKLRKLDGSASLFASSDGSFRVYIRYSKLHGRNQAFYGLRKQDLEMLHGVPSAVCFLWDKQQEPLIVPAGVMHELLSTAVPAQDGQYKAQLYAKDTICEFCLAGVGRFNFAGYSGWSQLEAISGQLASKEKFAPTHSRIQSMLGAIGTRQGFDVWIPSGDRQKIEQDILRDYISRDILPVSFKAIQFIIGEIDVIWFKRGSAEPHSLFEVEHTTPIYTGLLRFNDVHLSAPLVKPKFSIVAPEPRRQLFIRALNRPTFRASGLSDICTFLEYDHLKSWHSRIIQSENNRS